MNDFLEREWRKGMNEEAAEKLVLKAFSLNISLSGNDSKRIQTASVNSKGVMRAFFSRNTLSKVIGERVLLECLRARLTSEYQRQ